MSAIVFRDSPHSTSSEENPFLKNYPGVPEILHARTGNLALNGDSVSVLEVDSHDPSTEILPESGIDANTPTGVLWLRRWATNELAKDALGGRVGQLTEVIQEVAKQDPESALGIAHNLSREVGRLSFIHGVDHSIHGRVDRLLAQQSISIILSDVSRPSGQRVFMDSDLEFVLQSSQRDYIVGNLLAHGVRLPILAKLYSESQDTIEAYRMEASAEVLKRKLELAKDPLEVEAICQSIQNEELLQMKERAVLQKMRRAIDNGSFVGALRWSTLVSSSLNRQGEIDTLFDEALVGYIHQLLISEKWQQICDVLDKLQPRTNDGVEAAIDANSKARQEINNLKKKEH
jgi:hypothetical protein